MSLHRVIVYIDGFNLYHGLRQAHLDSSRWLDLVRLSRSQLKPGQTLERVRYFTSRVRDRPSTERRQSTYLDALSSDPAIDIELGHFLTKELSCRRCGSTWKRAEEKKTDVNIAVRLLEDAYDGRYDTALLVSGDSDLAPPLAAVKRRFPSKRLLVAFPPKRHSAELRRVADGSFTISASKVRAARFPTQVITPAGICLEAPQGWLPDPLR